MEYEDFSLKIEPKQGDLYPVIVLRSPAGEGRSSFQLPVNPDELGDLISNLSDVVRGSSTRALRTASPAATRTLPQQMGDELFRALFTGSVRTLLDQSLGMMHGRQRGLRIKLHIDPEDAGLARLASLPWELVYRKETRDFLSLSKFTPLVRYLDVQRPYVPLVLEPPLRVLVIIASPVDQPRLDLQNERRLIETSWARLEGVQVEFVDPPTAEVLQDRLSRSRYHVLHFMGHGAFNEASGRGALLLEDDQQGANAIDGGTLGMLLRDVPSLRLVFLNACETARVSRQAGLDPFAGVASSMILAGVPAAVAMQFPITDSAAITFARRFYALLSQGQTVDTAVTEGRRAIRVADPDSMEWATPVLFMRAPDGVLFQISEATQARSRAREEPRDDVGADPKVEAQLRQLYDEGLGAFWLGDYQRAMRQFQLIVDIRPGYLDARGKLETSRQRQQLETLNERARKASANQDWPGAIAALEELLALDPDYEDAAKRLEEVKRENRLNELYAEAARLVKTEQWGAGLRVFQRINALDPEFPDKDNLLPLIEAQVAAAERARQLDEVYSQGVRALDSGRWQEATDLFTDLQNREQGYRGADQLLARATQELAHVAQEEERQRRMATLYEQARGLAAARQWRQVQANLADIAAVDPDYPDPQGLAAQADREIVREEEETQRQKDLAARYAEAVELLRVGRYQETLETWRTIQSVDPAYPDREKVQQTARRKLQEIAKPPPAPGRRRWLAIGGVAVLVVILVAALITFWPTLTTGIASQSGAQKTVNEQFDNPAFDGSYNTALWTCRPDSCIAEQQSNVLRLEASGDTSAVQLVPRSYDGVRITEPTVFETMVLLDQTSNTGKLVVAVEVGENLGYQCRIVETSYLGKDYVACEVCTGDKCTKLFNDNVLPGQWRHITAALDPIKGTVTLAVDEQSAETSLALESTSQGIGDVTFGITAEGLDNRPYKAIVLIDEIRISQP